LCDPQVDGSQQMFSLDAGEHSLSLAPYLESVKKRMKKGCS
jgi:hypothetical protein